VPDAASAGSYYQSDNYISHTNTNKGIVNKLYHFVRKRTLRKKRQMLQKKTGLQRGSLLDIGAGTGAFANIMQGAGWNTTGLEPDEKTRLRAADLFNIQLLDSPSFFQLPAAGYDAITMWHVLEHVHELHRYIDQIKILLKEEGRVFIAVPNYTSYDAEIYQEYWAAYDVPRHLYHFSAASMERLLQQHGLQLIAIRPMWYDSFYISMLSEKYKGGGIFKAAWTGFISNCIAVFNPRRCSSLIYIAGK
jgi:2-polyprenyl-3-methyl-5-hydroxy-6-metoxy-1,4-benzoquinol methylase